MNKISIVGTGYWGPNLVRNFLKFAKEDSLILCDKNYNRLKEISSQYHINNFEIDYNNILSNKNIDVVVICTPAETHFELAKIALLSGKHVLLEKPMTVKSQDAEELIHIAKEKNLVLMVDLTYLYNFAIQKIKNLISLPDFGEIKYIDSVRVNLGIFRKDVNVLLDLACHDISIFNFILDKNPLFVRAVGKDYANTGQIDTAYINLEYENSIVANIHVSWLSPIKIRQMIFTSSKQSIIWDDIKTDEKIKIYNKCIMSTDSDIQCKTGDIVVSKVGNVIISQIGDIMVPKIDGQEALQVLVKEFIDAINNNTKTFLNAQKAIDVIKILEAANNSIIQNGCPISIE
jgi:predicted dehydrogenase